MVDPDGGFAFENPDRLGDRDRTRQAKKEMDVIVSPAAGQHFEIAKARDFIEVRPESFANLGREQWLTILGRKEAMEKRSV